MVVCKMFSRVVYSAHQKVFSFAFFLTKRNLRWENGQLVYRVIFVISKQIIIRFALQ